MDFEAGLIASIVREGFEEFSQIEFDYRLVSKNCSTVLSFIENHYRDHGKTVDFSTLEQVCDAGFRGQPEEPISFWVSHLRKKHLKDMGSSIIDDAKGRIASNPDLAIDELLAGLAGLSSVRSDGPPMVDVFDLKLLEKDLDYGSTNQGVPTSCKAFDKKISGWQNQDLAVIAARPSVGKTFYLILNGINAWLAGKKVLIVITEMSARSIRLRAASMACGIDYSRARSGQILSQERLIIQKCFDGWKEMGILHNMKVFGDSFNVTLESVEAKVNSFKPDIIFIDGVYLLKSLRVKERDKFKRVAELFDELKSFAKRTNRPVIVTSQLNRPPNGKTDSIGLERLAFSDNVAMVSDYIIFLEQTEVMKRAKLMEIQFGKMREAENYDSLFINWEFSRWNFDDVSKEEAMSRITEAEVIITQEKNSHGAGTIKSEPTRSKKEYVDFRARQVND